ncbi:hypothetical protein ACFRAQ_18805 [Nocardia sp. NPDC056611]|uniref:DUF7373 family lipoprotein n=1 Tax=Nocardia sp. NPDC056611 TaxID=3345877 RepID=UPI003671135F
MRRDDPMNRRGHAGRIPLVSIAVLVSACAIAGVPRAATPELRALDLGGYSGRPLDVPRDTGETYARLLESVRMADAVVSPRAVDPALSQVSAIPVPTPTDAVGILAEATRPTLTAHGMLAGFSIGGTDDPSGSPTEGAATGLRITVLRMHDPMAAIDTAREIDAADAAVNRDNVTVPFPEYFATHGHWRPRVPTMAVTLAHGPYVVSLYIVDPATDRAAMKALATRALDAELPRLDAFTATAPEALPALSLDPDGMLSRLLPAEPGRWPYPTLFQDEYGLIAGWGGPRRATGVVYGPVVAGQLINRPGEAGLPVQAAAVTDSTRLLRFSDAVGARHALQRLSEPTATRTVVSAPGGVPEAVCLRDADAAPHPEYTCLVLDGRYLASVSGPTEPAVHQMAAAQYAVLVTAR